MDEQRNDIIEGRNAVQEALRAGRAIDKIYIARGETDRALAARSANESFARLFKGGGVQGQSPCPRSAERGTLFVL